MIRRSAFVTIPVLFALACSASPGEEESVAATTSAYISKAPIDTNVASFKTVPSVPGLVYVLDRSHNLWREPAGGSRTLVDSSVAAFKPLDGTVVYVLLTNGVLYRESGSAASRLPVLGGVSSFDVGYAIDGAESAYVIDPQNRMWRVHQGAPSLVAWGMRSVQWVRAEVGDGRYHPGDDGSAAICVAEGQPTLLALGTGGNLWHGAEDWAAGIGLPDVVDGNVDSFSALTAANILVKGTDQKLWSDFNSYSHRRLIDPNVVSFAPLDSKTVYVTDTNGYLWREQYSSQRRTLIDLNATAFQPVSDTSIYVLHSDGSLTLDGLAPAACQFHYGSANVHEPDASFGFIEAWGTMTASGTCPSIPGSAGTWVPTAPGPLPGNDQAVPPVSCAAMGLPSTCCLYVWSPQNPSYPALSDPSVLCNPNDYAVTAMLVPGVPHVDSATTEPCPHPMSPSSPPCPHCDPM
jgi:hypothetical protein